MKVSYGEGLASHTGPKSCAAVREGGSEALTGVRTGPVLSREIGSPPVRWRLRGADALENSGRPHLRRRYGKAQRDPARSQTRRMYGHTLCGNREVPRPSVVEEAADRVGKPRGLRR